METQAGNEDRFAHESLPMKYVSHLSAAVLGLAFVVFGANFFLKFLALPSPPVNIPAGMFMGAMVSSGYMAFVKGVEILGGLLVLFPRTRLAGFLLLGPVIVNIVAFNYFFYGPDSLLKLPVLAVAVPAILQGLFLVRPFWNLLTTKA